MQSLKHTDSIKKKDILQQLLDLNFDVTDKEAMGEKILAPGLPEFIEDKSEFITDDCVRFNQE